MKKTLLLAALLSVAALPLSAGQVAGNYEQAQALPHEDGYVLVAYPQDWDEKSKTLCTQWLKSPQLLDAAGQAVFIAVPLPQIKTDETKAARQAQLGKLELPKAVTYPALFLMDKHDRHYATVSAADLETLQPEEVAGAIQARRTAYRQQTELLRRAALSKGLERAQLLGQAATVELVNAPNGIQAQVKAADPEDKTGYTRRLSFNPWGFAGGDARTLPLPEAIAVMEGMLQDPAYTPEQKQKICAAYIGRLRRDGGPEHRYRMQELIDMMRSLNPQDLQGRSADIVERQWVRRFSLDDGWSQSVLPKDDSKPLEMEGEIPITAPGVYELEFTHTGGEWFMVDAVELLDGDKPVEKITRRDSASPIKPKMVFSFEVKEPVTKPRILVYLHMEGRRNSDGYIICRKK